MWPHGDGTLSKEESKGSLLPGGVLWWGCDSVLQILNFFFFFFFPFFFFSVSTDFEFLRRSWKFRSYVKSVSGF